MPSTCVLTLTLSARHRQVGQVMARYCQIQLRTWPNLQVTMEECVAGELHQKHHYPRSRLHPRPRAPRAGSVCRHLVSDQGRRSPSIIPATLKDMCPDVDLPDKVITDVIKARDMT